MSGTAGGRGDGRNRELRWPAGSDEAQRLVEQVLREAPVDTEPPLGARTRVWSGLPARRRRRSLEALWPVGAAVAGLAVAGLLVVVVRPPPAAVVVGERFDLSGARGGRRLEVHGAAAVVLSPGTRAELAEDDAAGIAFSLEQGSLLAEVAHRPAGAPFRVRTPKAEIRVLGTVLWVHVAADGTPTVLVGRGAVEVTPRAGHEPTSEGGVAVVRAGERWPRRSQPRPQQEELLLLGRGTERGEPLSFAPPGAPEDAVPQPSGGPAAGAGEGAAAGEADGCSQQLGAAAVACFQRLSASSDPLRAETALYEMGWRQLRDLDDARGARLTWDLQRQRFPGGVLRSQAEVSIIQASVKLDDRARARREAEAWLAAHPDGLRAPEVHFLLASVERADGRCRRAWPHFEAALAAPADPWAAEARAQRAACLRSAEGHR